MKYKWTIQAEPTTDQYKVKIRVVAETEEEARKKARQIWDYGSFHVIEIEEISKYEKNWWMEMG